MSLRHSLSLLAIALLLVGCGKPAAEPKVKRGDFVLPVETAVVATQPLALAIHGSGAIEAHETVVVSARVAGVLDRLLVAEGDVVVPGAIIAEIDADRYRLALSQVESQMARARAAYEDAQRGVERREQLAKDGRVAIEVLDQSRIKLRQSQADLDEAKVAVEKARLDLRDATVTAPIGGTIQTRDARTGSYLQIGAPLVTLVQREPLQVRFFVSLADAGRLVTGLPVSVIARGNPDPIHGTIVLVGAVADPGTRQVAVLARLTDPGRLVWPGAYAEVAVVLPQRQAIVVPGLALRTTDRGVLAFVVVGGKAVERVVTLGLHAPGGAVEIIDGLTIGERVVVRAADGLSNGKAVRVPDAEGDQADPRAEQGRGKPWADAATGKP